jgi:hypothetical protein
MINKNQKNNYRFKIKGSVIKSNCNVEQKSIKIKKIVIKYIVG